MGLRMGERSLTDKTLFFDNDCISAFLWINNTSIVTQLYKGRVAIPGQVYDELRMGRGAAKVLKERIDILVENGDAVIVHMDTGSPEYAIYSSLALAPPAGTRTIGRGEAACIALAKERNGILASNNLRDIKRYIEEYHLEHITTADIIVEAVDKKLITEKDAEDMWREMLARRRRIGANSFHEYLQMSGKLR